jgi:thioredoxin-like negative regulator of GroEL
MIDQEAHVSPPIATVTGESFDALVIGGTGPIVVEFMSYGCGHCRVLEPVLQQVAQSLVFQEQMMRVNVAVEAELAEDYGIRVTPTLVMFLDGREIGRSEGPAPHASSLTAIVTRPFAGPGGAP